MFTDAFVHRTSPIHDVDPRVRVAAALALTVTLAALSHPAALAVGAAGALGTALAARLPVGATLRRLLPLNAFLILLWIVLPLTTGGPALFHVRAVAITWPGVVDAATVTVRANAIVLILTTLITTLDAMDLGRALRAFRVPPALVTLFLLTGRYVFVLQTEYRRLRQAMRVRAFRLRTNRHTFRTIGNLVGMLIVNGFDRSERVLHAMKCRGYTGEFPLRDASPLCWHDYGFAAAAAAVLLAMVWANTL